MSFSNLFSKLSDVKEEEPRHGNDNNLLGRSSSRKRKLQSPPGSNLKRQCLRSYTAHNDEEPTASEAHRYWTRTSKDPRPSVSTTRSSSSSSSNHGNGSFRSNDRRKGNTNNPNGQRKTKKNKGRKKEENVQRYKNSNNRGRREKNADVTEPRKRFMTQEFKDQHALEVDGRLLCKYFILGRCTKSEECQLEHIEGYNDLIKEACKFYIQGTCYKGATCPYMHTSIPCKFFHTKGWCKSDHCRFSHDPLTDCTRKVLDATIQRDIEVAEQSREAEEPVSQTIKEEQNTKEDIVIPAVRPFFYQSTEAAVEDEPSSLPHNEQQPDITEQDSAPQAENNNKSESSLPSDQPGPPVCYSVEAVLGPQLFRPVLYAAPKSPKSVTERNTVNAPYSVQNVLRSQSGYTSRLFTPVAPACELEKRAVGATDGKYEVSPSGNTGHQNVLPKIVKRPPSFHVTAGPERCHGNGKSGTELNCEADKTQEVAAFALSLTLAAGRNTAEYKRQIPKELDANKIDGQVSKQSATSSVNSSESVSCFLTTKQAKTIQQNQKETSESSFSVESSHATQSVAENKQDLPIGASLPLPCDETKSRFSHLFANLKSESDMALKTADSYDQKFIQATKPSAIATKATNCNNQEEELLAASADFHKPVSFSAKSSKEGAESAESPAKSFQSLFTSLDVERTSTVASAFSDKPAESSAEKLEKSDSRTQKALQATKRRKCTEITLEIPNSSGSFNNKEVGFATESLGSSNNNSQKSISSNATANKKGETLKHRIQRDTKTPAKPFQSLFANLYPTSEGTSSAETSKNSRQKPVSSSANSTDKQGADIERLKTPAKSFQNLFAAPLQESTVKNDAEIGLTEPALSQGRRSEGKCSRVTVKKMTEGRKCERETTAPASSSNVWTKASASQRPPHRPQTGPHTSVFKMLFQQLKPYEEH